MWSLLPTAQEGPRSNIATVPNLPVLVDVDAGRSTRSQEHQRPPAIAHQPPGQTPKSPTNHHFIQAIPVPRINKRGARTQPPSRTVGTAGRFCFCKSSSPGPPTSGNPWRELTHTQVHGLGGGSRRTWSASSDPASYWPKEWLPSEPGFRHVRIHSFGYDSDWTKSQQSSLTMHDFGQALLADLYNSPHLRKNGNVSKSDSIRA